jgi:hypothetical protein
MKSVVTDMETISILNKPALSPVSFLESAGLSPWPARLLGLENWEKSERDLDTVLQEYNEGWYASLLSLWHRHSAEQPRNSTTVQRYFYNVWKHIASQVEANKAVYNAGKDAYLFSSGEEFLVGELMLGQLLHQDIICNYVDSQLERHDVQTMVEPGCGTGVNLFHLYSNLRIDKFRGGEVCSNAVRLANEICAFSALPGEFFEFDYRLPDHLKRLTHELPEYALLTCHSIEQIQSGSEFVQNVLELPCPPAVVIHFEPIVWGDSSMMSRLCMQYARKNKYNLDLFDALTTLEVANAIEILDVRKRSFGLSAYNPTSIVTWRPKLN